MTIKQILLDGWNQYSTHVKSVKTQSRSWAGDEAFVVPALDAGAEPLLDNAQNFSDEELAAAVSLGWLELTSLPIEQQERLNAKPSLENQLAFLSRMSRV